MLITKNPGYTDNALPRDLFYGIGIAGEIETTNATTPSDIPATTNLGRIKRNLAAMNDDTLKAHPQAKDHVLKQK